MGKTSFYLGEFLQVKYRKSERSVAGKKKKKKEIKREKEKREAENQGAFHLCFEHAQSFPATVVGHAPCEMAKMHCLLLTGEDFPRWRKEGEGGGGGERKSSNWREIDEEEEGEKNSKKLRRLCLPEKL